MQAEKHDLLLYDTALAANEWIQPGYLVIDAGVITEIGTGETPPGLKEACSQAISGKGMAALPGLTNAHTHLSQVFMRGLAGGRPLLPWLQELIWPLQGALSVEDIHLAALLGLVENLRCGATHVVNNHKVITSPEHTDAVLDAAREIGLQFTLAYGWTDSGKIPVPLEAVLHELERLFESWQGHPLIRIANGPIAVWRCSEKTLQRTHELSIAFNSFTHIHTSESSHEVQLSLDEYGIRPVEWLNRIGVLDRHTQLVHSIWVNENELSILEESGASVVHCPVSNAVLGSGTAPVAAMLQRGIPVLLGTDGPASNDTQDIFETLKAAVSLARITSLDPTLLPPAQALSLALAGRTLHAGAPADVILVDVSHSRAAPVHDLASALVLSTHGPDVDTVISGGNILMQNKKVLVVDEEDLIRECTRAVQTLRKKAGID